MNRYVMTAIMIWCISVFLSISNDVNSTFDTLQAYLFPLYFICLFLACIMLIITVAFHYIADRKWYFLPQCLAVMLFFLSHLVATFGVINVQKSRSYAMAGQIINGLDAYHKKHGVYPDQIDQLVPDFVQSLPRTLMGWKGTPFKYRSYRYGRYDLYFDAPLTLHGTFRYNNISKTWRFYYIGSAHN